MSINLMKGPPMFKNRALQVKMVKSTPDGDTPQTTSVELPDPEVINQIAKDQVRNVAISVGAVIAGTKFLNTLSEIAIIAAKAKLR